MDLSVNASPLIILDFGGGDKKEQEKKKKLVSPLSFM